MRRLDILIVAVAMVAGAVHAQDGDDTNRSDSLARSCKSAVSIIEGTLPDREFTYEVAVKGAECFNYIRGFIDGHNMATDLLKVQKVYCVPAGVSNLQLAKVVVKTADEHPELGHIARETIVELALRDAWPCLEQGGST